MILKRTTGAAIASLILAACNNAQKDAHPAATPQPYNVLTLSPKSATIYNDFPATIEGIEIVQLRPMVDGYLQKVYAPEGSNVTKGQLLFQIENPIYEQAVVTAKA